MYDENTILQELNAVGLSDEDQQDILDNVAIRVGEAIEPTLTEEQLKEYRAIVDANQEIIDAWLAKNVPDYKTSDLYEEVEVQNDLDPDRVQPDKVVATIEWVKANVKDVDTIFAKVIADYREERLAAVESINLVQ